MTGLILDDRSSEPANYALNDSLNVQGETQIIHPLQRKPGHPFAIFFRNLPLRLFWMRFYPLYNTPFNARAKGLHQVVSERSAPFPGHMRDPKRWIQAYAKKLLQSRGEQDGISVIEQIVQSTPVTFANKVLVVQCPTENLP